MEVKQALKHVYNTSQQENTTVYAVGGFVRDALLGRDQKKDIDFMVDGSGLAFAQAFAAQFSEEEGRLIEFPDFDTARFLFLDREAKKVLLELEFAGARKEEYEKGSRKPVVTRTSVEEDLSRRDFTVNAMAQKVEAEGLGEIIDPFFGQKDLEARVLKTPLDPDETFFDDPLRMLRAARFAAQLDFNIDPAVYKAMHDNRKRLSIISAERIKEELMKLLATSVPSLGLARLSDTKLIDEFLPEVSELAGVEEVEGYQHKDNLNHTFAVVDNIAQYSDKPLLRLAGLLHDIAKPQTKKFLRGRGWTFDMHEHLGRKITKNIMRRLKFSNKDVLYVSELVRWHLQPIALMDKGVTDSAVRRLIVGLQDLLPDLLQLCRSDITTGNQKKKVRRLKNYDYLDKRIEEVIASDKLRAFQSPVRGEEIMEMCGLKPGPTIGKIKKEIERAILDGDIPNKYEPAKAYFESIKQAYLEEVVDWDKSE
jgi:poly(A) polymerase